MIRPRRGVGLLDTGRSRVRIDALETPLSELGLCIRARRAIRDLLWEHCSSLGRCDFNDSSVSVLLGLQWSDFQYARNFGKTALEDVKDCLDAIGEPYGSEPA
jgi:hypothetical protein